MVAEQICRAIAFSCVETLLFFYGFVVVFLPPFFYKFLRILTTLFLWCKYTKLISNSALLWLSWIFKISQLKKLFLHKIKLLSVVLITRRTHKGLVLFSCFRKIVVQLWLFCSMSFYSRQFCLNELDVYLLCVAVKTA